MKFYEYQTKQLFQDAGLPVPRGVLIRSTADIDSAINTLGSANCVVKAQVLAGGRGKAGGIQFAESRRDIEKAANELLGKELATYQSGGHGEVIRSLYLEEKADIASSLYFGMLVDRDRNTVVMIASAEGGVEIEKVAAETPEKIITAPIHPLAGYHPYIGRSIAIQLGLTGKLVNSFASMAGKLYNLFTSKDGALIEINPLVITGDNTILALDGKLSLDDNADYRQKALVELYRKENLEAEDKQELQAKEIGVSYVSLDGNIGCMVNGAGLAMATMDMIKHCGGEPANFLDVGGGVTEDQVRDAFALLTSDNRVKGLLVNIFGGIVRCDLVAEGIVRAASTLNLDIPIVVRLQGTNVKQGKKILEESGLTLVPADHMDEAANKIVELVGKA